MKKVKNILFGTIFANLLILIAVLLFEVIATFALENASILEGGLLKAFRSYYLNKDRIVIQYLEDCAKYDSELTYTLKPGKCRIKNREFEVDYFINSLGVRDEEAALNSPEIVVAGDSHAMGWGVDQEVIFSRVLENRLGMSVLNAAIPSYGTVRELKILERVNLSNLKYLIIQYCSNDYRENSIYANKGNKLPIIQFEKYQEVRTNHKRNVQYFFGKHSLNIISALLKDIAASFGAKKSINEIKERPTDEVDVFLNAISSSPANLSNIKIIVFEVNGFAKNDNKFVNKLNKRIEERTNSSIKKNIQTIDFSTVLEKENYFHLDDHINSSGHQVIAESLVQFIKK